MQDWAQFGLAAVLIGAFFVPFILAQQKSIADKDKEISRLNDIIRSLQDQRLLDMKEVIGVTVEPIKEFKGTADAILRLVKRRSPDAVKED